MPPAASRRPGLPKNSPPKRCEVSVVCLLRLMLAFVIVAVVSSMNTRAGRAYQTGDSKWCAVTNKGADSMQWDCEYMTLATTVRRLLQALAVTVQ